MVGNDSIYREGELGVAKEAIGGSHEREKQLARPNAVLEEFMQ